MRFHLYPALQIMIGAIASLLVAACAGSGPKPQPEPPKPIASIALLPVAYEDEVTPPTSGYPTGYVPFHHYYGNGSNAANAAGAVAAGLAIIASNIKANHEAELRSAVSAIKFQPVDTLNRRLQELLRQKGLNIEVLPEGGDVMTARRSGDYSHLSTQAEAVLDVRIGENGYFHSMRAGGFSPMFGVKATLASRSNVDDYDSFSYWSDWRESKQDRRWFQSSPASIFKTTDELAAHADIARAELDNVIEKMAVQIAEDIQRRAAGLPSE